MKSQIVYHVCKTGSHQIYTIRNVLNSCKHVYICVSSRCHNSSIGYCLIGRK